jgi:hypothetical protein
MELNPMTRPDYNNAPIIPAMVIAGLIALLIFILIIALTSHTVPRVFDAITQAQLINETYNCGVC